MKPLLDSWPAGLNAGSRGGSLMALPIYAMFFAMQAARSMYVIIMSWFALQITGEISAVGKVLMFWQLFSLTFGPLMGIVVDRFKRRTLFIVGECLSAAGVFGLAFLTYVWSPEQIGMPALYIVACVVSLGSLLSLPAIQALVQMVGGQLLMRVASVGMFTSQIGNILGAALGGTCIAIFGLAPALGLCASFSIVAAGFSGLLIVKEKQARETRRQPHIAAMVGGFQAIGNNPYVLATCFVLVFAYSISHITNVFLGAFTLYELELNADAYGWIAAALSCGGIVGSLLLASVVGPGSERLIFRYGLFLLAIATAGFSTAQNMWQAVLWHGVMGLSFVMLRTVCDVQILKTVPNEMIGRVQSNVVSGAGAAAVAIYLLPSVITDLPVRHAYFGFASVLVLVALRALWLHNRAKIGCGRTLARPSG